MMVRKYQVIQSDDFIPDVINNLSKGHEKTHHPKKGVTIAELPGTLDPIWF